MQDNKYIPIVAAVLVLAAIAAGAYYFIVMRPAPTAPVPTGLGEETMKALAIPSDGPKPTTREAEEIKNALAAPGPKTSSASSQNEIMQALAVPAE